jgi:hypothetical protein
VESPIEAAEELIRELREKHDRNVIGSIAIHQREESAACLERLIEFHRGYRDGTMAETSRLVRAVSALLSEIARLQDAQHARMRHGLPENQLQAFINEWLNGSAPRLWALAEEVREILRR